MEVFLTAVAVSSVLSAPSPVDPSLETGGAYATGIVTASHRQGEVFKNCGHFPSDEAATKRVYLALRNFTKSWENRH